jgi:predicted ATP-grasp superfamily ATP-dependent carboligase
MAPSNLARQRVGAVVIGGDYQGLGIARSLGRRGIPVCVVDDECSIARFSRYVAHAVRTDSLRDEGNTVEILMDVGRRFGLDGWLLYPTRDETVAACARYRSVLSEIFRVPTPGWDTVRWLWDKRNTYELARELGIPVPRTACPRSVRELEALELDGPVAIKPAIKEHFVYATKAKAWRADTREERRQRFEQASQYVEPGEVMIQELIPGNGNHQFAYAAFFKNGRAIGSMVVRRQRQHPPEFGRASTFVQTIELPILETLSQRFLQAIDYYGLVELEYKFDARDGQYKLLDVNGRTWGYHTLGAGAGVDFPYLLYADQIGESVEPTRGRAGVNWIRLVTDVPTAVVEMLGGRLDWREYFRSVKSFDVEAVFKREDPLPGIMELALIPYLSLKRGF